MLERRDPMGQGSQPGALQPFSERIVSHAERTTGRGMLVFGGHKIAEVEYSATLTEVAGAFAKVPEPVYAGYGTVIPVEGSDFDPDAPGLVLHMDDGRSVLITIEAPAGDRGYRFQVVRTDAVP